MKQKLFTILTLLVIAVTGAWADTEVSFSPTNKSITNSGVTVSTSNTTPSSLKIAGADNTNGWKIDSNPISIVSTSANISKIEFIGCTNSSANSGSEVCGDIKTSSDGNSYSQITSGVTVKDADATDQTTGVGFSMVKNGVSPATTVTVTFSSAQRYVQICKASSNGKQMNLSSIKVYIAAATAPSSPGFSPNGGDINGGETVSLTGTATTFYYQWSTSDNAELTTSSGGWTEGTTATVPNTTSTQYLYAYASNGASLNSDVVRSNAFTVTKVLLAAGLAYETTAVAKEVGDAAFTNTLTNPNSLTVSYASSNTSVATVNSSTGEVTIVGAGETTITASSEATSDFLAGNATYTLTVSKKAHGLAYETTTVNKTVGDAAFTNTLTNPNSLTVSYESSDEAVATIDSDGEVTIVGAGTATITASTDGNATYASGSATYTLTVKGLPTYKSDFTDGQIIWTTKDVVDAACAGATPWMVLGAQVTGTDPKTLKSKSLINPEDESESIAKYSTNTYFYVENTVGTGNDRSLSLYVTGVEKMSIYGYTTGSDSRTMNIKVNGEDAGSLSFTSESAQYTTINLTKGSNNIITIYGSNQVELYAIKVITDLRTVPSIAFETASGSADISDGNSFTLPDVTTTPAGAELTYSSSDPSVASVNASTGAVRLNGIGTTTITASFDGDEDYKAGSGTYTLTVTSSATGVAKYSWQGGASAGAATEVGGTAVASDNQSVDYSNGGYYTIRLNGNTDFSGATVTVTLTNALKKGDIIKVTGYRNKNSKDPQSGFKAKFNVGSSTVSSSTGLEFVNIDTSDGSAEDSNRGDTPNTCSFAVPDDAAGSTQIIMTRSHGSTAFFVTKLEVLEKSKDVTITSATWASFSNANEVAVPEGVTAYYVGTVGASSVTLKEITDGIIPAETGVVLNATAGTYSLPYTNTSASLGETNYLHACLTDGDTPASGDYYTLAVDGENNPIFKKSSKSGTLAAGKSYLVLPAGGAPSIIRIVDEENNATNLENLDSTENAVKFIENGQLFILKNGITYDLLGRIVK